MQLNAVQPAYVKEREISQRVRMLIRGYPSHRSDLWTVLYIAMQHLLAAQVLFAILLEHVMIILHESRAAGPGRSVALFVGRFFARSAEPIPLLTSSKSQFGVLSAGRDDLHHLAQLLLHFRLCVGPVIRPPVRVAVCILRAAIGRCCLAADDAEHVLFPLHHVGHQAQSRSGRHELH